MTILDLLFVLPVYGNPFWDKLLHHLPRDQGEADQPGVHQIPPLALLEETHGIWVFFPLSGTFQR